MKLLLRFSCLLAFFVFLFFIPGRALANEPQFITIVNPVRISSYNKEPAQSLKNQYGQVKTNGLPATWLLTFDAMVDDSLYAVLKNMDKRQELGIFLEVTPGFAKEAGVTYHDTGFWHHATSVFLSGYTQEERKLLIDSVFEKFHERFGFYPVSVGSWWTDAFSLNYMKEKYAITGNLGVSDQFSTDGYMVWGTPWSVPFYPTRLHAGIPASSKEIKLDLVVFQWAPRDPFNGYESSLYSTQDYRTKPDLPTEYFESLVKLYAGKHKNEFGQITVGLESDFTPEVYQAEFKKQMEIVSRLVEKEGYAATNMKEFSRWYRERFPDLPPAHIIETKDLVGKDREAVWYQSHRYRVGLVKDIKTGKIKILDLRVYSEGIIEPYFLSPNRENELFIYIPSVFDEINFSQNVWNLPNATQIKFELDKIVISSTNTSIPRGLEQNWLVEIRKSKGEVQIIPQKKFPFKEDGKVYKDYSSEAIHFFRQKKALFYLLTGRGWNYFKKIPYSIPQGELYAIFRLSLEPKGKVLVANSECLQCEYHTSFKHPAFSGRKTYIKKFSGKPIVYNSSIFETKDREEAKKEFQRLGVKYIYLLKFESYIEKLPFSPGDLGVEKIFENANAQIWRVKK